MRIITLIICILLAMPVFAQQSRADLENRKKEILKAIHETEDELAATKKDKNATMGQLRALQNKLAERQRLIGTMNEEIGSITSDIQSSSVEVVKLREQLELQRMHYAQSVRYAYETRSSYDILAFLFSSDNFNEAVRRMRYLKKFRDYRKQQVDQIRATQSQITHKIGVLNTQKTEKDQLLNSQMQQKQVLQQETNETNAVVKDLKGREKQLAADIEKNKKANRQVDKAINDVIRREIELARKKAAEEEERKRKIAEEEERKRKAAALAAASNGGTTPRTSNIKTTVTEIPLNRPNTTATKPKAPKPNTSSYTLSLTPEVAALSNNFESNKGRLPWPVDKGFISEQFGRHQHPVAEKVMVENYGVDIRTASGATVRAVFDGKVSSAFYYSAIGWTVIIDHGRYYTVYRGLSSASVKKDQQVKAKQTLGVVGNNDEGEPTFNFQIWKVAGKGEPLKLDPSAWIAHL